MVWFVLEICSVDGERELKEIAKFFPFNLCELEVCVKQICGSWGPSMERGALLQTWSERGAPIDNKPGAWSANS